MDVTKGSSTPAPIYEDFVPTSDLVSDQDCDTLVIHLPGFKKEQMRVQLTKGILRVSGSMPIGDNKMRRFQKEFSVSINCDTNKITAKFDNGILYVKQPKLITPATTSSVKPEQHIPPPQPQPQPTPASSPATQESKKPVNKPHATQTNGEKERKENGEGKQPSMKNGTRNEEKMEAKEEGQRKDKVPTRNEGGGVNTIAKKYGKMAGAMGERLKMQRKGVHVVLAALITCIVAIYVNSFITSLRQPEN